MERKKRKQDQANELPELSSSETRDGILVRVRCMEISDTDQAQPDDVRRPRYEIFMEARGRSAVADVPAGDRVTLSSRIDEIVGAFVDSLRLGAGSTSKV